MQKEYRVEVDSEGCTHCGHGKMWIVIDPDGIGGGTSYCNEEEAIEIAEMLTDAFEAGEKSAAVYETPASEPHNPLDDMDDPASMEGSYRPQFAAAPPETK